MEVSDVNAPIVLLYHRIGAPKLSSLVAGQYVAPWLFKSELECLAAGGWRGESLAKLINCLDSVGNFNEDLYCITFDDGYLSVYEHAIPLLSDKNIPATIYIVSDTIGGINEWDHRAGDQREPMMSKEQIKEISDAGYEIGSHTLSHPHLPDIPDDQLVNEIADSKHRLEDLIGKQITSFSYPYGDYNAAVIEAVVAAGYTNAVSTKLGAMVGGTSLFEIPRVNVRWNAVGPHLMRKIGRARGAGSRG